MRKFLLSVATVALGICVAHAQFKVQGIQRTSRSAADMFMPEEGTPVQTEDGWVAPTFDDIEQWYGHGSKKAALLIQFSVNGETHSRMFGYRFDESIPCGQAWTEIAQKDPHLVMFYETSSGFGGTIQGFGWDGKANGFSIVNDKGDVVNAENGWITTDGFDGDGWKAVGDDDTWCSGWFENGYWSYWWNSDISEVPGYSGIGSFGNTLEDGMIDVWIYLPDFNEVALKPWEAVPEYLPEGWTSNTVSKDGLYYRLQGAGNNEVDFIAPTGDATAYSGDINVPSTVEINGKTYNVTYIDSDAFKGSAVTSVVLPVWFTDLYEDMFAGCTELTSVSIPGLTSMAKGAFKGCSKLADVPFPTRYSKIPESYAEGTQLASLNLRQNITIGANAFRGTKLTSLVIPANCQSAGEGAFNCENLTAVKVDGNTVPTIADNTFSEATYTNGVLTVQFGYEDSFKAAAGWSKFAKVETFGEPLTAGQSFYVDEFVYQVIESETPSVMLTGLHSTSTTGNIVIPQTVNFQNVEYKVTSIKSRAFSSSKITGVTINENITVLPEYCFYQNKSLATVSLPEGLTEIGNYCFAYNSKLTEIEFPESLTTLGNFAFYNTGLTSITLPENLVNMGETAFGDCMSLESVTFNNRPTYIPKQFLSGCRKLPSIVFPESVTSFGEKAVSGCYAMTSFTFPQGVTEVSPGMLSDCEGLTEVVWPENLQKIGGNAFWQCRALETITIPEGVTELGAGAFSSCFKLKEINLPSTLTKIGNNQFKGCSKMTSFSWPTTVNEIPEYCFSGCSDLVSVEIPENVTWIGQAAFNQCSVLPSITLPAGLTSLEESIFGGCKLLTKIDIPATVTSIGKSAFNGSGLTEIVIPDNVTSLGNMAFAYCYSLTNVVIGKGVTELPDNCFDKDKAITAINIPAGVVKIGRRALAGLSKLKSLELPEGLREIGEEAFAELGYSISSIVIPASVESIAGRMIYSSSVKNVYFLTPAAPDCASSSFNYASSYPYKYAALTVLPFTKSSYTSSGYKQSTITELSGTLNITESYEPYVESKTLKAHASHDARHNVNTTTLNKYPAQFVTGLNDYIAGIKLKFQYRNDETEAALMALVAEEEETPSNDIIEIEPGDDGVATISEIAKGTYQYRWVAKSRNAELKSSDWKTFTLTENVTGLNDIEQTQTATVDVYSITGICLMKGVDAQEALNRLTPGLYIINGRKVLIKR